MKCVYCNQIINNDVERCPRCGGGLFEFKRLATPEDHKKMVRESRARQMDELALGILIPLILSGITSFLLHRFHCSPAWVVFIHLAFMFSIVATEFILLDSVNYYYRSYSPIFFLLAAASFITIVAVILHAWLSKSA